MTTSGPPPVDCQILQFKRLFKLKIRHDTSKNTYQKPTNLIAVSPVHGLTFVGEKNALKVIATTKLYDEVQDFNFNKTWDNYHHRNVVLPASPTHIDINAEQKLLAVAFIDNDVPILRLYVIDSFLAEAIFHFPEIRLSSTSGTYITDLSWNPGIPNILACCISDGSLSTYTFNSPDNFEVKSLPKESCSVCVCWSPKGKQIVVGNFNGYLTQYLPELRAVKNVPPPTGLFPKACTLCSVKWISNFQFIGVFKTQEQSLTDDEEIKSCVVVINTPKNGPIQYINYDDVCFSGGTDRPVQFYFNYVSAWNLIFVSSSNSLEVAILSLCPDNQTWILWNLEPEEMRITLPFLKSGEAFPIGVAVDYSMSLQTSINNRLISMPALSILTCEGILCIYLINYLNEAAPNVCIQACGLSPPQLQYFSAVSVCDEEPTEAQSPEIVSVQESSNAQDLSGIAYNLDQSIPPIQDAVALADAALRNVQEEVQISSTNLLNKLNSAFNFETSITNRMSTNAPIVQVSSVSFDNNTQNEPISTLNVAEQKGSSLPSSSSEATGVVRKVEPPKPRQEAMKKLKKRGAVFENDIQEIKYLVSNINVGNNEPNSQIIKRFAELQENARRLKTTDTELRNDVDLLRTSIIEVFACVQDVKSKLFQFMNPGYQSLTGIRDIDPTSSNNLKNIQSTVNYVQTQVDKANKQLEEMWLKFSQNPASTTTKVPILENVYETMLKQQKILGYLKLQMEKLEKRFTTVVHRLTRENRSIQDPSLQAELPWSHNKLRNESMSLDDLTKKALNLNAHTDDQLHPKQLALKYSREHAKRFHLSYTKQVKLQELHSTSSVAYIQSSRLQRLKKKSLIILSKSTSKPDAADAEELAENLNETPRAAMISPVSSDEEKSTILNNVVSSTPLKNKEPPQFIMENTFPTDPSIIKPATNVPAKLIFSSSTIATTTQSNTLKQQEEENVPSSIASKIQEIIATTTKEQKQLPTAAVFATSTVPSATEKGTSFFGTAIFEAKSPATTTSMFTSLLQQSSTVASTIMASNNSSQPATTTQTIFSGIGSTDNTKSVPGTTSTQGSLFSGFSNSSLFSNATSSAISTAIDNTPVPNTAFSFALPKTDTLTAVPSLPTAASTSSIFSGKPLLATFDTVPSSVSKPSQTPFGITPNVVVSSSATSDVSFFKTPPAVATTSGSFATLAPTHTVTTTAGTATVSKGTSVSATYTVVSSISAPVTTSTAPSVFETASIFGKSYPNTNNIINSLNFGSMLSGSLFAEKPTVPTSQVTVQKNSAFSSFSFASKPVDATSSLTITEVTNDDEKGTNKENISVATSTPNTSFNTVTTPLSFSPVNSVSANVTSVPTISDASTATSVFASTATTPDSAASTGFSAAVTVTPVAVTSGAGAFDNASSFFGSLKLGAASAAGNTNVNAAPIFGKAPSTTTSSAQSAFSSSGANIFSQTSNVTVVSTAAAVESNSKPLFGSGTTSLFGQGTAAPVENKNLFSGGNSGGTFQSTGSVFSSGGSMFGGSSTFGAGSTTQSSTFSSGSGGSVFGSNFGAPFQNSSSGFGSPTSFSNTLPQQQPSNTSGFGSPASFPSVFGKTGSAFPAFGSAATFGGSPAIGASPTNIFGQSGANYNSFGSTTTQQPPAFDTLANENTLTFGNLAQQPPSGFGSPPSFGNTNTNSTFGSSTNFGRSSFSSWR